MGRIVNVTALRDTMQVTVFDGTRGSADDLGLHEYRVDERDAGPDQPAWNAVTRDDYYGTSRDNRVEVGAMFERQLIDQDGSETYGPWQYVGQATEVGDIYVPVNIDRDRLAAPGAPMRRPEGSDLILPDGTQPDRPAVGEQDFDPLTGEPLVDENGNPVLVAE